MSSNFFTGPNDWDSRVRRRLEEIREHYPLEDQFAIWVYSVLTGKENITRETRESLIALDDAKLKAKFEAYSELYESIAEHGVGKDVEQWANIHTGYKSSQSGFILKRVKSENIFVASLSASQERERYETLFGLYQRIYLFLQDYQKTKITDVNNFIGKDASNAVALPNSLGISFPGLDDGESALDIAIPNLDKDAINEKAKDLAAHSVSDVTGFGNDVAIEAAQIVSKLSYYFTQQAAKPHHTLALVEDIISEARASAQKQFVDSDPRWLERTFTKPQLLPADQMPLADLVQKAVALPTVAANDNKAFGKDLEIADHAMKVLGAYHEIMRLHKEALEQEKDRLSKIDPDKDDLISAVVGTGMDETIEKTLQRLDGNMAFIKIFAKNFFDISRLTAESRQNLSGMASLAAVIQAPAMSAIGEFQAYQLRRFRQFGRAINDKVTEEFGAIASDISAQNDATPDKTQRAIEAALGTMIKRLEELPDKILPVLEERTGLAAKMQEKLLEGPKAAEAKL